MLYWAAKNISENIKVLDFGGSFASAFFQNLRVLSSLDIKWKVVEQQHFVDAAKKIVNDTRVTFFSDVEACIKNEKPNFAHFGSSLQYLENPYLALEKISTSEIKILVLDRIPVHKGFEDIVAAQRVSDSIYDSSYPVWILSEEKLKKALSGNWLLLSEFYAIGGSSRTLKQKKFNWKGYIFVQKMAC
jgi:putative methyltransferase (TIGR04325 family)